MYANNLVDYVLRYPSLVNGLVLIAGDLHEAKANFELALEMNSLYEKARSWQRKVTCHSKGRMIGISCDVEFVSRALPGSACLQVMYSSVKKLTIHC